jgi:hypothetical protein
MDNVLDNIYITESISWKAINFQWLKMWDVVFSICPVVFCE